MSTPASPAALPRLLPASVVCDALSLSREGLRRITLRGDLPVVRLSTTCLRYREADVLDYIDSRIVGAGA